MTHFEMIQAELEKACAKHPKFCDEFTAFDLSTAIAGEVSLTQSHI